MRECLFGLELIERELVPSRGGKGLSLLAETLDRAMLENPEHWKSCYAGSEEQERLSRKYSFSDRSRYYWTAPAVQKPLGVLMANLCTIEIPPPLLSQYLPLQYRGVMEGSCSSDPDTLVRRSIVAVLEDYASATGSYFKKAKQLPVLGEPSFYPTKEAAKTGARLWGGEHD